jgi:hypothetical protein
MLLGTNQQTNSTDNPTAKQIEIAKTLKIAATINCCTSYLKLNELDKALDYAQQVRN